MNYYKKHDVDFERVLLFSDAVIAIAITLFSFRIKSSST